MGVPVGSAAGLNECEPVNLQFGQTDKINETTPYYFSMAFPALFPDGRGDISAPNHVHGFATSGTSIGDYHTWMSILFRFHDNRFAEDAGFALLVVRPLLSGASNSPCRPASPVGFAQLSCARRGSRVAAWIPVACAPRFPAARLHARAVCLGSRAAHLAQGTR